MIYFLVTQTSYKSGKQSAGEDKDWFFYDITEENDIIDWVRKNSNLWEVKVPQKRNIPKRNDYYWAHTIILQNKRKFWDIKTFEFLINQGFDIHQRSDLLLIKSIQFKKLPIIRFLIQNGADINQLSETEMQLVIKSLNFNTKYKLNLSKEELKQSSFTQYLSWAEKKLK